MKNGEKRSGNARLTLNMDSLFVLIFVVSCSCVLAGTRTSSSCSQNLTAHEGQPLVIDFGFKGSSPLFNTYTKDGSPFRPDGLRTFASLGKISFTSCNESDGGVYEFTDRNFHSTACLTG